MTRDEKREQRREERAEAREKVVSSFKNTVNDDKKSNKILIAMGIFMVIIVIASFFLNNDEDEYDSAMESQDGYATNDEYVEDIEVEVSSYDLHDETLVGMWGSDGTEMYKSIEDFDKGSWIAYNISKNGNIQMAAHDPEGGDAAEYGTWSTDDSGNLGITWLDKDGNVYYTEKMKYETIDGQLFLDDVEYYPIKEDMIFS